MFQNSLYSGPHKKIEHIYLTPQSESPNWKLNHDSRLLAQRSISFSYLIIAVNRGKLVVWWIAHLELEVPATIPGLSEMSVFRDIFVGFRSHC